ncbi:hypothetical protein [Sulfitobacter sp. EE-36]|uniref:hypothetical protein n=1 Tax=Sulfitobacter TaxID=60136 RepID=UPI000587AD9C|nr:hypothetical protein [Sulfitobacter sp. EE-36]
MKQAQFITLMSESLGVEEKTIKMIVRNLREAGLFTTGARGVNAPDIQPIDAVRVVIAVVASPSPGKAVRDVKYFGSLKPDCRDGTHDDASHTGLDRDKTLEETLLDCLSNRFRYDQIIGGLIRLSENGDAFLVLADGWQDYYQREQWQAVKKEFSGSNDNPKDKAVLDNWEAMQRISNTKVNRSAEFPLEELHQIGFEIIGWDVD